jgi:hypothetical protein
VSDGPADPPLHHDPAVAAVGRALARHGYEVTADVLDGLPVVVGRRSDFRLRWMAVRLQTFVVVARFRTDHVAVSGPVLDRFLDAACAYAAGHKGGLPRGLQTGTAAVAVAVVDSGAGDAATWAGHPHGRRFAAMAYPVAVEVPAGRVVHPPRLVVGAVFNGHLRRVAEEVVGPALRD